MKRSPSSHPTVESATVRGLSFEKSRVADRVDRRMEGVDRKRTTSGSGAKSRSEVVMLRNGAVEAECPYGCCLLRLQGMQPPTGGQKTRPKKPQTEAGRSRSRRFRIHVREGFAGRFRVAFDVGDGFADRGDRGCVVIGNLDAELALELHDELDRIERVCAQVGREAGFGGYLGSLDTQFVHDDLRYLVLDFGHGGTDFGFAKIVSGGKSSPILPFEARSRVSMWQNRAIMWRMFRIWGG